LNWSLVPKMSAPEPLTVKTPPLNVAEPAGEGAPTSVSSQGAGRAPGVVTVSETGVVWLAVVDVPVTVIGYVPGATELATLKVSDDEPPVVTDPGPNPAVTPDGRPEAEREMDWATPDTIAVETLVEP
jgi:hypothetical protein